MDKDPTTQLRKEPLLLSRQEAKEGTASEDTGLRQYMQAKFRDHKKTRQHVKPA